MSSPSPPKSKWTPGGAIRRTSTILSMGRPKTPSRASSEYESDSASSKGAAPALAAPAPKSISPKSTISMESSPEDASATPSKSRLARMGGALRRPSSLIPRRRTTSMASSSFRDGDSTHSKTASGSVIRSSIDREAAPQPVLTAEPEVLADSRVVPEPRTSLPELTPESAHTPPPQVIGSAADAEITNEPEEIPAQEVSVPVGVEEAAMPDQEVEPAPLPISAETTTLISETEAPAPSSAEPVSAPLVSEQTSSEPEPEETLSAPLVPAVEPVPTPTSLEIVSPELEAEKLEVPSSAVEAALAPPSPEPTPSVQEILKEAQPALEAAVLTVEEPAVPASPSTVAEQATEPTIAASLREASSLNSSFEDLGLPAKLTAGETLDAPEGAVEDEPVVLHSEAEISEAKEDEYEAPTFVALSPIEEEPQSPSQPLAQPSLEVTVEKNNPVVSEASPAVVLPSVEEPQPILRSLPLQIPATSPESAAPSPAATHPLLPLETQEASTRQRNGSVAPARDRHQNKAPEEYRSVLSTLLEALLGLIRRWRRGHW